MKGLDVAIVRLLPFILYIIFGVNLLCCSFGVDITLFYELHGNSAIYATALYLISLSNKKYHCKWNRAMYLFLIVVPIMNFLDSAFDIISDVRTYYIVIYIVYAIVAIYTAYHAIKHFVELSIRRMNNGRQ